MPWRSRVLPAPITVLLVAACARPPAEPQPPPAAAPPAGSSADRTPGFAWTTEPSLDQVPDGPVSGAINGQPFEVKTVVFQPGLDGWNLILAERELSRPTELVAGCRFISLELPEDPAVGKTLQRPMRYGNGFIQLYAKDDPDRLVSWNSDNAWVLQLTRWEVKPDDPDSKEPAGVASGKVAVCYQAGYGYANAWAAGSFTDAIVRYRPLPDDHGPS